MRFLVTCGPTYESLDQVRRLTNFSTGKLGIGLANHLHSAGHEVTLLKGYYAVSTVPCEVPHVTFTTTDDLLLKLQGLKSIPYRAIFHAAAVSDFQFGQVFRRLPGEQIEPIKSGKFSTREGTLLAELLPTRKIIALLRDFFPEARICGWKYEVDGTRQEAIESGRKQIRENRTDFCVVNGPAYPDGYGIAGPGGELIECATLESLNKALLQLAFA